MGAKKTIKDTQKRKKMLSVGSVCDDFTAQEGGCGHSRHACRSHEHLRLKRCIFFLIWVMKKDSPITTRFGSSCSGCQGYL